MAPLAARAKPRGSAPTMLPSTSAAASDLPPGRSRQSPRLCLTRRRRHAKYPRLPGHDSTVAASKTSDADWSPKTPRKVGSGGTGRRNGADGVRVAAPRVASARRLAAALWHLRPTEVGAVGGNAGHYPGRIIFSNDSTIDLHVSTENELASPVLAYHLKNGIKKKLEVSSSLPVCAMEKATKWDPGSSNVLEDVCQFYGHLKLLEDQQVNTVSVLSALQLELEQARRYISELESERQSAKKKFEQFLKRLAEEKSSWRSKEHEKVRNVIGHIKNDFIKEKKSRKRLEVVNAKLVNELAGAKLSANKCLQNYDKERKARMLMEEVCDDLAMEIREDKAEVESLKRESVKLREEVDEERRMLQMAEVWREERVQMKLVDAKLMLEEKYVELCSLQADIEAFLSMQNGTNLNMAAAREADMLKDAACSCKVQVMDTALGELYYQPPGSGDFFSVVEGLHQPREETNEREIEQCYGFSPPNHSSKFHRVSPETDIFLHTSDGHENGRVNRERIAEDDSGWETVSQVDEQASFNSPEGSDPSVNGVCQESHTSVSGIDWDDRVDNGKLIGSINENCSTTTRQSRKKVYSIGRFWRTTRPNNGHKKNISAELSNGRLSNSRMSIVTQNSDVNTREAGMSSPSAGQRSPESLNPHINRGMKGCVEWPRGVQKHSLKEKLMEARMENQKIQLLQSTKHKD